MQNLRLFCDVAHYHSFSQAAAKHGITQSAVSQRVSQLEKRLGVKLIDRSVRPLELTACGELFLRGVIETLDRYEELEREVIEHGKRQGEGKPGEPSADLQGELHIEAIYSAGIDLLAGAKSAFESRWPHARVAISYKHPDEVHQAVRDRQCDLGIVSYPDHWRDVHAIELRRERMAVVCSPRHPLARAAVVQAVALSAYAIVSFEASLPVGRQIRQYLRQHGVAPSFASVFDNIDTIKTAVTMTDAVAILPQRAVRREVESGTLVAVRLEPELVRPLGIIHRKSLSQLAEAFTALLRERVAGEDARDAGPTPPSSSGLSLGAGAGAGVSSGGAFTSAGRELVASAGSDRDPTPAAASAAAGSLTAGVTPP